MSAETLPLPISDPMLIFELFVRGLLQGSIYALIAVGLTLVYGILRILHVAHAGLYTLGGYMGVLMTNWLGNFPLSIVVSMFLVGVLGMILYRLCYHAILDKPPYVTLIASIGLFIAMEEVYRILFGPDGISYLVPPLSKNHTLLGITLRQSEILIILGGFVLISALGIFVKYSSIGIVWRATVTDPQMAESFGIDILKVRYLNFFIGSALAAFAGVMVSLQNNQVEPTMGSVPSYKALAIIVLGGLGSIRGTVLAALILGVAEAYGTIYLGDLLDRDSIAFTLLIIVLMLKPQGIFGRN